MSTISRRFVRAAGIAVAVAGVFMAGGTARGDGGTWTTKAPMPGPRAQPAAGLDLSTDRIFVAGGSPGGGTISNSLFEYAPSTDQWQTKASMPTARYQLTGAVIGGVFYCVGGTNGFGGYAVNEAYQVSTNTWSTKAPMPTARVGPASGVVNGRLYVVGGSAGPTLYATVEVYDPVTNSWSTAAPMPTPRIALGVGVVDGILYAIGGFGAAGDLAIVEAYDSSTNTWSAKASMPTARGGLTVAVMGGTLYACGGYADGDALTKVEAYDPATDSWSTAPPMSMKHHGAGAAVVDGVLYVMGGGDPSVFATVEAFTPAAPTAIQVPASIVQPCDDGTTVATVNFLLDITGSPPATAVLTVRDLTGNRTLLTQAASAGQVGVGPNTFPLGTSTVEVKVTDGTVVLATATFAVQIQDTEAPDLSGIEAKTIECTGPLTSIIPAVLGVGATDACDPHPVVTLSPSALPLGTTRVSATARDASGNTASSDFDVTVRDTTPPVFTLVPADVSRGCEGADGATVAFEVRAADLCGEVSLACLDESGRTVDPAGTSFAVGVHTVTCTATDSSGNSTSVGFGVAIVDDDDPLLVVPADITVPTDPGKATAAVPFTVSATDACDPSVAITCSAPSGEVRPGDSFPLGLTTVTCTARDRSGNLATGSFRILVVDREAPVITAPATASLVTDCAGSALSITPAALGVSARDNADPAPALSCSPTTLVPGTTAVDCTATDAAGNVAHASVSVTVLRGTFQVQFLRPLDGAVDNLIKAGQTIPVKVRVTCSNVFDSAATATVDSAAQIDGTGTAVANETVEDSGLSNDNGTTMRLADGSYIYNLSTKGWSTASGARFRVRVRVQEAGHVDTFAEVTLKNR
jgi:N-acetylneuraminic acid mutarotase